MLFISPLSYLHGHDFFNPALLELARKHGVEADDNITPVELSERLQTAWYHAGKFSYQIQGGQPDATDLELLRQLGCVDEVLPPTETPPEYPPPDPTLICYQGALVLGATRPAVVRRLAHLVKAAGHAHFLRGFTVYLLGGARPLDPALESPEKLLAPAELPLRPNWAPPGAMPTTEAAMMELVWRQSILPDGWHHQLIDTPLQPKAEGGTRPPNTGDTIKQWLEQESPVGAYLAVSSNPHVTYQGLVIDSHLGPQWEEISIFMCGPAAPPTLPLPRYLDAVAKQLFEEVRRSGQR